MDPLVCLNLESVGHRTYGYFKGHGGVQCEAENRAFTQPRDDTLGSLQRRYLLRFFALQAELAATVDPG